MAPRADEREFEKQGLDRCGEKLGGRGAVANDERWESAEDFKEAVMQAWMCLVPVSHY